MKNTTIVLAALGMLIGGTSEARGHAGTHYSNQGGHFSGGHGSSHKGGHYVNPKTGNHYRHHPH
jgi:hypothetical protein